MIEERSPVVPLDPAWEARRALRIFPDRDAARRFLIRQAGGRLLDGDVHVRAANLIGAAFDLELVLQRVRVDLDLDLVEEVRKLGRRAESYVQTRTRGRHRVSLDLPELPTVIGLVGELAFALAFGHADPDDPRRFLAEWAERATRGRSDRGANVRTAAGAVDVRASVSEWGATLRARPAERDRKVAAFYVLVWWDLKRSAAFLEGWTTPDVLFATPISRELATPNHEIVARSLSGMVWPEAPDLRPAGATAEPLAVADLRRRILADIEAAGIR